jgi:hypothetical protein
MADMRPELYRMKHAALGPVLVALIATSCGGSAAKAPGRSSQGLGSSSSAASTGSLSQQTAYVAHSQLRLGQPCPLTRASSHPRVPPAMLSLLNGDASGAYGQGPLWVVLPNRGANATRAPDGQVYVKVGWYVGLPAALRGTARRIGGNRRRTGRLQTSDTNTEARRMEASALLLPTEGCWQVTGEVHGRLLTWIFSARLKHGRARR